MNTEKRAIIVGAGAAGLMAAEALLKTGHMVDVYEAMPSPGRKILMAGKSGLNLSHAEQKDIFVQRYGAAADWMRDLVDAFDAEAVRAWAGKLGVETFVGSSGRIFPKEMKAAPLLREWLRRLKAGGMRLHVRHRWSGFGDGGTLLFDTPNGQKTVKADAVLLATGGSSWPSLGSDGTWMSWLQSKGVSCNEFKPANCGFDCDWSDHFRQRFAGEPVKSVTLSVTGRESHGDFVVTDTGIEGSAVYAVSAVIRDHLLAGEQTGLFLDLAPDRNMQRLIRDLSKSRGKKSFSSWFRAKTGLAPVKAALLREVTPDLFSMSDAVEIAALVKTCPVPILRPRPIEEAISVAGGVALSAIDADLMLRKLPGVFVAGEMLDWEAPTGGYLLTACFAQGQLAGQGMGKYLDNLAQE